MPASIEISGELSRKGTVYQVSDEGMESWPERMSMNVILGFLKWAEL